MTYLDSCFGKTGFGSQPLASAHARIVALVELLFKFVELVRTKRGPIPSKLWLFGATATAHALHVVFAAVDPARTIWKRTNLAYFITLGIGISHK